MSHFIVADDDRWLDVFGIQPRTEQISGDNHVPEVVIPVGPGDQLQVTWDRTDSSLRLRHERGGALVLDLYRELVTQVSVERRDAASWLVVEYGKPALVGRLHVRVDSGVTIEDSLLQQ